MTPDVITLSPEQKCIDALHHLKKNHIRRAPVLERKRLVGIVSEWDCYRVLPNTLWHTSEETYGKSMNISVKDTMTTAVHSASPNDHLEMAARLMLRHKIGAIPVLKDGQIEGIITESDIFKAMWGILSHKTSYRILFFDRGLDTDNDPNDYIELCLRHTCRVNTFISYPRPEGGHMHYLCIKGAGADGLVKDLWTYPCDIVFVEKDDHTLGPYGQIRPE